LPDSRKFNNVICLLEKSMTDDSKHESVPPLPWAEVANRIRKLQTVSMSSAAFARALASVAYDLGYELKKIRKTTR
jgi:hypothetical protein